MKYKEIYGRYFGYFLIIISILWVIVGKTINLKEEDLLFGFYSILCFYLIFMTILNVFMLIKAHKEFQEKDF